MTDYFKKRNLPGSDDKHSHNLWSNVATVPAGKSIYYSKNIVNIYKNKIDIFLRYHLINTTKLYSGLLLMPNI